jgi:BlaI family transcriptional regulator, penicillinase repressor
MMAKGLIEVVMVHGIRTFAASQPKLRTLAGLVRDFMRNVLDSTAPVPAATFVNSRIVDRSEVKELEALIKQLSRDEDKPIGR